MSAMEQSLRRALDAGDASDPAFRESIYAASERALERMLSNRPMDEAAAQAQRIRLAETINRVEQDYYEATSAAPEDAETWAPSAADHDESLDVAAPGESRAETFDDGVPSDSDGSHPGSDVRSAPPAARPEIDPLAPSFLRRSSDPVAERSQRAPVSRTVSASGFGGGGKASLNRFRRIFAAVVLLAFAVLAYLVYGMIYGPTTQPADATTSDAGQPAETDRWIALFDGTQLASIATPTGGRVETVTGPGDRPAVRMSSAGEGGEIEVAVGPGIAQELAGERVRVEVTVGSPDGEPREFGVRCLFSGRTVCGTQRFRTALSSEAFVFEMAVPRGARSAGSIAIEPGYGAGSRALDLFGVRARLSDAA